MYHSCQKKSPATISKLEDKMAYIKFTDDQKQRAASVDLEAFLLSQGEKLLPSGREKRLAGNHSVTVRGNEWFDHATKEGTISSTKTIRGTFTGKRNRWLAAETQFHRRSQQPLSGPTCQSGAISASQRWPSLRRRWQYEHLRKNNDEAYAGELQ